ncbi:hypothetical protein B0J13DRAFT_564725 [Dactylonectria estremocensis]|uniref:Secreted protein CSS2 C-terminal domain-containing protein n=1 Tax=Dactylonectria estremocensis TaxID=1079267 RepID=A0A9P9E0S7_9HYPO|nr:hypothetical protein B0J13DRAFT_564725 [Dactylonectria estremocensis]
MRVSTVTVILFTSLLPGICSAIETPNVYAVQEPIDDVQDNVETSVEPPKDADPIPTDGGFFTRETLDKGLDYLADGLAFIGDFDGYLTRALGSLIGKTSKTKPCINFGGVLGKQGEITYRYQTDGAHCYSANEQKTIREAIIESIKRDEIPATGTQCLDLTKGGDWDGYLLIGRTDGFDHDIYCGPEFDFTPLHFSNDDNKEEL